MRPKNMKHPWPYLFLACLLALPAWGQDAMTSREWEDTGRYFLGQGRYAKALPYFRSAVEEDPSNASAHEGLGDAYSGLDERERAMDAYRTALKLDPGNEALREKMGRYAPEEPEVSQDPEDEPLLKGPPKTRTYAPPARRKPSPLLWSKIDFGYAYSLQGGLLDSAEAANAKIRNNGWTGLASASHHGFKVGGELGFPIGEHQGFALGMQYLRHEDYRLDQDLQNGGDYENERFGAYVIPLTLDYYLFLPDEGGKFFLSAGVGYYHSRIEVEDSYDYSIDSGDPTAYDEFRGELTAGNVGFQASIGREFTVSQKFAVSLFAKGRYARIGHYRGTVVTYDGYEAQVGLGTYPNGEVHVADVSSIGGGGLEYTTLDFTGFDVGVAFVFYHY